MAKTSSAEGAALCRMDSLSPRQRNSIGKRWSVGVPWPSDSRPPLLGYGKKPHARLYGGCMLWCSMLISQLLCLGGSLC